MKAQHYFSGAALIAALVLAVIGFLNAAGVGVAIATVIELIGSAVTGKQSNT